ncbi:restriction endonuclease [Desmonostoc muscorum LEGE 12446]|uniref:Restriction endonuclease n=1 Tax=Desmonostoc muscorum LEGE 12446 TaxID=1828758 RepID=A0A8J7DGX3_DESMC|nr:restriction endonuclease [Desmonostoc muscorum]MCF2145106.1 restriction endonuclease [Desmonostoc muscorum LEGE 12446]
MNQQIKPIQKIIFGSPGIGKSFKIRSIATEYLQIHFDSQTNTLKNTIKTVFHPEYTYSDFVGKLLPQSQGNSIIYKFYSGHFIRALGLAYRDLLNGKGQNYLLVIDELNRGNAAAIFGSIFQLLDRENDNWSTYEVDLSDLELIGLFNSMGYKAQASTDSPIQIDGSNFDVFCNMTERELKHQSNESGLRILKLLKNRKISIPNNLSLIATINTSDESIYYLDSAFKRRWDWEYLDAPAEKDIKANKVLEEVSSIILLLNDNKQLYWYKFVVGINEFIKSHYETVRKIEDKQIGWWFIKAENDVITLQQVQDKLMFYLWDSVFARDKKPLIQFLSDKLGKDIKLITYADFVEHTEQFVQHIHDNVTSLLTKDLEF